MIILLLLVVLLSLLFVSSVAHADQAAFSIDLAGQPELSEDRKATLETIEYEFVLHRNWDDVYRFSVKH